MKKLVKKAITVISGASMLGATLAMASAAAYPAPFDAGNTAIVVGANAAPSDTVAAATIASDLSASMVSAPVTVEGGESFKFEKTSNEYDLSESLGTFATSKLDNDDLPETLASGTYEDSENEEIDFDQYLEVADNSITLIVDKDLNDKEPTLGFKYAKDDAVMNYSISFDDGLNVSSMDKTDLMLAGKEYYVLSATTSKLELLDAADSIILSEGETSTINVDGKAYTVSIEYIEDGEAKVVVNGEVTNKLSEGDSEKLDDGAYVAVKEILFASKESGVSKVELAVGKGKLILEDGKEVELNDDNVDGLRATIEDSSSKVDGINIGWYADEDTFVTEGDSIAMPAFELASITLDGINFPTAEMTTFDAEEDTLTISTEIKEGSLELPVFYNNGNGGNFSLGADSDEILVTTGSHGGVFNVTLNESEDTYFVVTHLTSGNDAAESYAYQITDISENTDDEITCTIEGLTGEAKIELVNLDDDKTIGEVSFKLVANSTTETVTIEIDAEDSGSVYGDRIVTTAGLSMLLPVTNNASLVNNLNTTALGGDTYVMTLQEANDDNDRESGDKFTVTLVVDGTDGIHASTTNVTLRDKVADDESIGYQFSALATMVDKDTSGDLNELEVSYYGEEVVVDAYLTAGDVVISSETGKMTFTDAESSAYAGKNLIVVGGSAINSVAADLLGTGAGETFTANTDVSAGEFLIESFDMAGKTATVVAGYNAEDTTKAAIYLTTAEDVSTSAGAKYIGASATESATMVSAQ